MDPADGVAVLVNGLPGSGKTSLAMALAAELSWPCLSRDAIKEQLAATNPGDAANVVGAVAMRELWRRGAEHSAFVAESWWFRPRDLEFALEGLEYAGVRTAIEVWCDAPAPLARTRFESRTRGPVHRILGDVESIWAEWAECAEPLGICPVIRVDTTVPVDLAAIVARVAEITDAGIAAA
ncbi:AAA family ATPase [Planctomonas psychrotolerans]|uniref:AAA family ATPase n=1 Tax=Planctomonas psychrotolerans TaxID=2528712 RepID=UPI00123A6EBB|nr:AAA family ATPase [Planctomonas psychrotolerans]